MYNSHSKKVTLMLLLFVQRQIHFIFYFVNISQFHACNTLNCKYKYDNYVFVECILTKPDINKLCVQEMLLPKLTGNTYDESTVEVTTKSHEMPV